MKILLKFLQVLSRNYEMHDPIIIDMSRTYVDSY